jgi:hypothetical protein
MAWAWAWHGNCESDTAAVCKSNGTDTLINLSGTAWQGTAWARHAMCESALKLQQGNIALSGNADNEPPIDAAQHTRRRKTQTLKSVDSDLH